MAKPVVVIDIDDVLITSGSAIIADYNRRWNTKLPHSAFYATHDTEAWGGVDEETAIRRVDTFVLSDEFIHRSPMQDVFHSLRVLTERFELHVLTGRNDLVSEATVDWLDKYFPGIFVTVNFSNLYAKSKYRSKGEMCAELGAEILIDDHLDHLVSALQYGVAGVLFGDYPWNQADELPDGVVRCKDWVEVLRHFDARKD